MTICYTVNTFRCQHQKNGLRFLKYIATEPIRTNLVSKGI